MRAYFTKHPSSVGESYFQHMRHALSFSGMMAVGTLCCLVHALLPFLFEKTGSRIISNLYDRMLVNRAKLTADQTYRPNVTVEIGR